VQYWQYDRDPDLYVDEVDSETRIVLNQFLFSYKVNPQTMLFVGYSDIFLGDQEYDLTQTGRTVFAKLGYAWVL
jgi:hypothetical protein